MPTVTILALVSDRFGDVGKDRKKLDSTTLQNVI